MFNMFRTLMDEANSTEKQMGNVSREVEILRKKKKSNAIEQKSYNRKEEWHQYASWYSGHS